MTPPRGTPANHRRTDAAPADRRLFDGHAGFFGHHDSRRSAVRKVILCLVLAAIAAPAAAQNPPDTYAGKLSGAHWQFNIIGHPNGKGISEGWDSNGRSVMIPLKTETGSSPAVVCEAEAYVFEDDIAPTSRTSVPMGTRLHFVAGDTFAIIDRDGMDGNATVQVPVAGDELLVDVYLRALGKPNTCMDIDAFAFDAAQGGGLYFWAGTVEINRKTGKSAWVKVNYLFDVWWCQVDTAGACIPGTEAEYSVFNDIFEDYFWNIQNNGMRNVQVRLYPKQP
jgi:hypothetical protein